MPLRLAPISSSGSRSSLLAMLLTEFRMLSRPPPTLGMMASLPSITSSRRRRAGRRSRAPGAGICRSGSWPVLQLRPHAACRRGGARPRSGWPRPTEASPMRSGWTLEADAHAGPGRVGVDIEGDVGDGADLEPEELDGGAPREAADAAGEVADEGLAGGVARRPRRRRSSGTAGTRRLPATGAWFARLDCHRGESKATPPDRSACRLATSTCTPSPPTCTERPEAFQKCDPSRTKASIGRADEDLDRDRAGAVADVVAQHLANGDVAVEDRGTGARGSRCAAALRADRFGPGSPLADAQGVVRGR